MCKSQQFTQVPGKDAFKHKPERPMPLNSAGQQQLGEASKHGPQPLAMPRFPSIAFFLPFLVTHLSLFSNEVPNAGHSSLLTPGARREDVLPELNQSPDAVRDFVLERCLYSAKELVPLSSNMLAAHGPATNTAAAAGGGDGGDAAAATVADTGLEGGASGSQQQQSAAGSSSSGGLLHSLSSFAHSLLGGQQLQVQQQQQQQQQRRLMAAAALESCSSRGEGGLRCVLPTALTDAIAIAVCASQKLSFWLSHVSRHP